jgi:hypothetical protein
MIVFLNSIKVSEYKPESKIDYQKSAVQGNDFVDLIPHHIFKHSFNPIL